MSDGYLDFLKRRVLPQISRKYYGDLRCFPISFLLGNSDLFSAICGESDFHYYFCTHPEVTWNAVHQLAPGREEKILMKCTKAFRKIPLTGPELFLICERTSGHRTSAHRMILQNPTLTFEHLAGMTWAQTPDLPRELAANRSLAKAFFSSEEVKSSFLRRKDSFVVKSLMDNPSIDAAFIEENFDIYFKEIDAVFQLKKLVDHASQEFVWAHLDKFSTTKLLRSNNKLTMSFVMEIAKRKKMSVQSLLYSTVCNHAIPLRDFRQTFPSELAMINSLALSRVNLPLHEVSRLADNSPKTVEKILSLNRQLTTDFLLTHFQYFFSAALLPTSVKLLGDYNPKLLTAHLVTRLWERCEQLGIEPIICQFLTKAPLSPEFLSDFFETVLEYTRKNFPHLEHQLHQIFITFDGLSPVQLEAYLDRYPGLVEVLIDLPLRCPARNKYPKNAVFSIIAENSADELTNVVLSIVANHSNVLA